MDMSDKSVIDHRLGRFNITSKDGLTYNTEITVEGCPDVLIPAHLVELVADVREHLWKAVIHVYLPQVNLHNVESEVFIHSLNLSNDHWLTKLREHTEKVEE